MAFTYLRPDADDTDGGWTNDAGGTALFSAIDEVVVDDNDFIKSSDGGEIDAARIRLSNPGGSVAQPATVRYRYKKVGSVNLILTVTLYQGATPIASWSHSSIGGSFATVDQVLTTPQFASITDFDDLYLGFTGSPLDASTIAWIAAVVANGGSVSGSRESLVDALIVGLKADGIFAKLDRLWLFAGENEPSALTDIIADALATNVNSTTFTTDRGYTGNGSSMYIDSNFNPTTATSPHYIIDDATVFGWNNTAGMESRPLCGVATISKVHLYPEFTDGFTYARINAAEPAGVATSGVTGLYLVNTINTTNVTTIQINGSTISSLVVAPTFLPNEDILALKGDGPNFSGRQISCLGFGASLSTTEASNLYTRLRTYMTAVGVP
jgi:hypothetical protein